MKLIQYKGPFQIGDTISVKAQQNYKYVHIGIQIPNRQPIAYIKNSLPVDIEINGNIYRVNDTGILIKGNNSISIVDVKKAPHGQFLHKVELDNQVLNEGDEVVLKVDINRRNRITANHSATHLLQSALKQVVGDHITQAGSYNSDE